MHLNTQAPLFLAQQSAQAVSENLIPARHFDPNVPFGCLAFWRITSSARIPSQQYASPAAAPLFIIAHRREYRQRQRFVSCGVSTGESWELECDETFSLAWTRRHNPRSEPQEQT